MPPTSPDKSVADELAALNRQIGKLEALVEIGAELSSELNLDRLLDLIMTRTTEVLEAERSTLFLVDRQAGEMWTKIAQGTEQIRMPLDAGIAGRVATTGQIMIVHDAYECPYFNREFDRRNCFRTRSVLAAPMRTRRGEIIGVAQAINKRNGAFTEEDEDLLTALSAQAAVAIEIAQQYEERKRQFDSFVRGLAIALDARDHLTSGHTARVTHYAVILAEEMGLPPREVELVRYSGWLHDLGKIGVPDRVLCKPS
jgi:GAF domain-containing protein